MACATIHLIKI